MISWEEQPYDVGNIYNPAFLGEILRLCVETYTSKVETGLPLELAYVVLPILMFKDSRQSLMSKRHRFFRSWLDEFPDIRVNLGKRARQLNQFVRLAVLFTLQHNALILSEEGTLLPLSRSIINNSLIKRFKSLEHVASAQRLAILLAQGGQLHNVFIALGVRL